MDTRFWGPSGWKFLHLMTFTYDPTNQRKHMRLFLESLPYVLPCKFCRASLTDYYSKHPFSSALESRARLTKWLYTIHNEVNEKLRKQDLNPHPDPTFQEVKQRYTTWIETSTPIERLQTYWDFLFSIAYCHPYDTAKNTKPMPNCPPRVLRCKSRKIKNKWNTLCPRERMPMYKQFWHTLPDILEPALHILWSRVLVSSRPTTQCRKSMIAWLWRMRCALDNDFKDPYTSVCRTVASYSSDCGGSSTRAKTCRKKR